MTRIAFHCTLTNQPSQELLAFRPFLFWVQREGKTTAAHVNSGKRTYVGWRQCNFMTYESLMVAYMDSGTHIESDESDESDEKDDPSKNVLDRNI
jgi:hypothetical protein